MKIIILSITVIFLLFFSACKNEVKKELEKVVTEQYIIKPEATTVNWTAYKTTDKTAVSGKFIIEKFENKSGATPTEALNNLEFSIPVSSIFSKDEVRDGKIVEFFFGAMLDTELLRGTIKFDANNQCYASITMNGVTYDLPLKFTVEDERRVNLKGVMELKNWDALGAIASLSKVCFDLHKGADGVSKTWTDVAIEITTFLREK